MERNAERFFVDINIRSQVSGEAIYSTCSVVVDLSEAASDLAEALLAVRAAMGLEEPRPQL